MLCLCQLVTVAVALLCMRKPPSPKKFVTYGPPVIEPVTTYTAPTVSYSPAPVPVSSKACEPGSQHDGSHKSLFRM